MSEDPTFEEAKAELLKCKRRSHWCASASDQDIADAIAGALMSVHMSSPVVLEPLTDVASAFRRYDQKWEQILLHALTVVITEAHERRSHI